MEKFKTHLFAALAGIISGVMIAMGVHNCNRQPIETVKVERDTVTMHDTIAHYYPKPVEVTKTRTEYRWLPTAYHFRDLAEMMDSVRIPRDSASFPQDSVLVEVPIESRHYHSDEYDAYISGYEPSLDSIKVYQKTEYITERITQMKPPNRWELDLVGGINYYINGKKYTPHVGGELLYKPNRLQVGVRGEIQYDNTVQPYLGGVVKLRLL